MLAANVALAVLLAQRSVAAQIGDADANCVGWWARQCRWGRPAPEGLSSEEDSACSASGEAFPPVPGATWAKVLEQMTRCITGFYEGRYLEVQWDPINFWQHWPMDGDLDVPATFGICIPKGRCQDFAIQWLLIPLLWVYVKKGDLPTCQQLDGVGLPTSGASQAAAGNQAQGVHLRPGYARVRA
eukprot:g5142.t1